MKKLLFILFLGLLLVSCSQNKKDTALENCADDGFINHKDPYFDEKYSSYVGMVVSNWGKDKIGNKRLKQSKDLNKKINSAQKKFKAGEVLPKIMTDGWEKGRQRARNFESSAYYHFGLAAYKIVPKTIFLKLKLILTFEYLNLFSINLKEKKDNNIIIRNNNGILYKDCKKYKS